ncbi:cytochrome c551 [Cytobacillus purgationiresistens]|uniref:Cytochrome c551 n=1 Tax=Cytobacillus purgationiresistens TaxID=863449 RepID=A0ABU0AG49_9BACI|nr:cytochrome c [Cytobacillus purgationiresistens]MDQ0269075.1 cytochrome c551 [Cytobacillus purgationiresistens]
MKKKLLALLFGSVLVLAACGGGNNDATEDNGTDNGGETTTADAGDAEKLYEQSCISCHGGDLSGGAGPNLQEVGAKYSKDEILDIIENGKGAMPGNLLSGDEAAEVADWLAAKK